jgi:hypothetical protein
MMITPYPAMIMIIHEPLTALLAAVIILLTGTVIVTPLSALAQEQQ